MQFTLIVVIVAVSLLIGLSKGGLGAALVVLTTPLLTLVMPAKQAVSTALPLLILADGLALWMYWKKWDMRYIRLMLPMAVIGVVIGTYLLATLPELTLRRLIGGFALIFVIYRLLDNQIKQIRYQPRRWHGWLAGGASGMASALANNGAPPFTAYMLLQEVDPVPFIGTTTLFFAVVNLLKVPTYLQSGILNFNDVLQVAWASPLIVAGVVLGRWLVRRMNRVVFEYVMLAVLTIAALILLLVVPTR